MKFIIKLLTPYLPAVSVKIINRLMKDNDRLNTEWRYKYDAMEREMYYWQDKYIDEIVHEPSQKL